jgi:NAD(P)H-hydrate epimerase
MRDLDASTVAAGASWPELMGHAIRADVTVAIGAAKRGLFFYPARSYVGALESVDIGILPGTLEALMSETITAEYSRSLLPARPADAHKGTFGKALIVAGSLHYPGAATLATAGAGRVGAGLVTLATARSVLGAGGRGPEVTLLPLPEADWGTLGPESTTELFKHIEGYTALLVGPGLGGETPTREFIERLLGLDRPKTRSRVGFLAAFNDEEPKKSAEATTLPPAVLDADALNHLAAIDDWPEHLPRERFVFTPHPGEMKRLLALEEVPGDLVELASDAAERWGQVLVLKGATTVIAAPDGRTLVHSAGNPALATAGTGDVLAGAICGLLAQGLSLFDAAALGVYLHGAAGALVREEVGEMGALASDLLPRLPRAIATLRMLTG